MSDNISVGITTGIQISIVIMNAGILSNSQTTDVTPDRRALTYALRAIFSGRAVFFAVSCVSFLSISR